MHQLCREFVLAKRIAAGLIQIGQPLVLKQQKQESLTCFIRFYLTVHHLRYKLCEDAANTTKVRGTNVRGGGVYVNAAGLFTL